VRATSTDKKQAPKDYVQGILKEAGLTVRRNGYVVLGLRMEKGSTGAVPALTFECRRWNDGSYSIYLQTGAHELTLESVLAAYQHHQTDGRAARSQWTGLTLLEKRQIANSALYDDLLKSELKRFILQWRDNALPPSREEVETRFKGMITSDEEPGGRVLTSADPDHPYHLLQRAVVARDLLGFDMPGDEELCLLLGSRSRSPPRHHFDAFTDWWAATKPTMDRP
jgi:hypothetical protein